MTIDKQTLRQKSESASAGEWVKESWAGWHAVCSSDDQANSGFIVAHFEGPDSNANREFVQAANPPTVLALLDELEAKDRRIEEEIGRANREHHRGFMMACGHLKEHSNVHYADAAEMEIAALRNRIAELRERNLGLAQESFTYQQRVKGLNGIILSARQFISEYAESGDAGADEFVKVIDCASMIGSGEDDSDKAWARYVGLIDRMLKKNGHERSFKGED